MSKNKLRCRVKCLGRYKDNFFPGELGWCGLLAGGPDHPATTVRDIEHYGSRMIAHDVPISIQTSLKQLESNPQSGDILVWLNRIDTFRRSGGMSESQREQLKTGNWSLVGAYGKISVQPSQPDPYELPRQKIVPDVSASDGRVLFRGNMRLPSAVPAKKIPGALLCSITLADTEVTAKDCRRPGLIEGYPPPAMPQDIRAGKTLAVTLLVSGQRKNLSPPYPVLNIQLEDQGGWYRDHFIDLDFVSERTILLRKTNVERLLPEFGRSEYKHKRSFRYFDYGNVALINLRWMRPPKDDEPTIFLKQISAIVPSTGSTNPGRDAR